MDANELAERIFLNLPYDPNDQQIQVIASLARFCAIERREEGAFLLCGYAGTGKTSLTGALVRALREAGVGVVLMAPTGRAAKVFGGFARHPASTIHRRIYRTADGSMPGAGMMEVAENTLTNTVFIVDEASMIGDDSGGSNGSSLLEDLIQYVYSGEGCRMILLGDTAQLPPVGCTESPAMNRERLRSYGLKVTRVVLTDVVRQGSLSGILYNATRLRRALRQNPLPAPKLTIGRCDGADDVAVVSGEELEDVLSASYADPGEAQTLIVTRSNKRAVLFNKAIRSRILYKEEELCRDERLMVAKNNYLWSARVKGLDFVANGDLAVVEQIYGTETKYGMRFADVRLRIDDRDVSFDCKLMLDTLTSESASLESERLNALYMAAMNDPDIFAPTTPVKARMKILRSDPYVNALQVKYAYCITCHKAQGGQWDTVFVDLGFTPADADAADRLRWLYTAVTRATRQLMLVNPPQEMIE